MEQRTGKVGNAMTREIPVTNGHVAIVDDDDYERISKFHWSVVKGYNTFYAKRGFNLNGKHFTVVMHREIMRLSCNDGILIDHRDRNGLDNRKCNLRIANKSINAFNSKLRTNNNSGFRGVHFHSQRKRWQARICINNKRISLGLFDTPMLAANAYAEAILKYKVEK